MTQTCPGLSVGAYSVTATGGTSPYQYSLDDGKTYQTSPLFTGLGLGSYALVVKDANGCVVKPASYQMSSSVAPTITPQVTNVSCNGLQNGSILVDLTGGADLGQTYASINNGTTFTTNFRFNSLGAGVYPVVVKYGNNCLTPVQSTTLTQPAVLAFNTTKVNVTGCFGNTTGSISVTATGGTAPYQYSKDNGATFQKGNQFTDLGAGTYAVVVSDVNGCQTSAQSIVLTQPSAISYTVAKTNVSCNGSATGSFTVTASGGTPPYRLSLNGGEFDAIRSPSGLAAGDYTIAVGDANGCSTSQSTVTISQPDPLTFTSTLTEVSCAGETTVR
ncbi:hypothetical protein GO730_01445 [Spirosoma sp. HMF3257]|uniref:SprB repeat-containing protein n=1 Tax=Spirosoma telluris TaxID=2183553 RepID=A0A327NHG3_9BACT|nr:hypothetical protein [Spirosoma telluris]RAI73426.1 hypothetical protein HMF3257_01415 [Spirosoma telluris]